MRATNLKNTRLKPSLYVFEGPDGVGKSTLSSHLDDYLKKNGFPSERLSFPGREIGTLAEHIYRLYHDPRSFGIHDISITPEQLLVTAAHADVIENRIIPSLSNGKNIVLDRFWWSTWVYSTSGGLDPKIRDLLIDLELAIWREIGPTCIFLVHRSRPKDSEYTPRKWKDLNSLYGQIRRQQNNLVRIVDIDNTGNLENTVRSVLDIVHSDLKRRTRNKHLMK